MAVSVGDGEALLVNDGDAAPESVASGEPDGVPEVDGENDAGPD